MKSVVCYKEQDLRIVEKDHTPVRQGEVAVAIEVGGICGSDLHYYNHGGTGTIRLREPMILGHEVAGHISELGEGVQGLSIGDLVAVNPSQPCGICDYCRQAKYNHCLDMLFYGSAMRFPHVQGAFSQQLVVKAEQCHVLNDTITASEAAFAEPVAVAVHAIKRAGNLAGKRVLVTGSGPIGVLVAAVAKIHGAIEVVSTDVVDEPLFYAREVGADRTINVAAHGDALAEYSAGKGTFDVVIEASGNEKALNSALEVLRPQGRLIQLGLGGSEVKIPLNLIVTKEIEVCGTFRFHEEFAWAVALINSKRLALEPLVTAVFPINEAVTAFETANDRASSLKVQLVFNLNP